MTNIELKNIDERKRKAVQLIAAIGGFGDDYHAVSNALYKSDMFLYDLNSLVENRKYKSIINMLKNEYPIMNFEKENNMISDDEKILRRSLRGLNLGYNDEHFFNPKYDKDELIRWDDSKDNDAMFKVKSSFKDSGAYHYSLTNTNDGIEHGGRIDENELRKPTTLEKITYYKKHKMLDVHLFNKLTPMDEITKEYGLSLLEALKGIDIEDSSQEIREIAYAAQKGYIDMNSHFNTLAMISDSSTFENNPMGLKLPKEDVTADEILALEKHAIKSIDILDQYRTIYADIKELKKEIDYKLTLDPENKNLEKIRGELPGFNLGYNKLSTEDMTDVYGSAHWSIKDSNPDVYKKIDEITNKTLVFIQQRDMYLLNRPDLNSLIEKAGMTRDSKRKDMTIFRGSRNNDFDFPTIRSNFQECINDENVAELNIANNGFRREVYQAPSDLHGGSNFGYCEGDLSLVVPKNKDEFNERLENGIRFYVEDEFIDNIEDRIVNAHAEMNEKLNISSSIPIEDILAEQEAEKTANKSAAAGVKL